MDLSKFRPGDWLLVAGGVAMLFFGLALDWAEVEGVTGTTRSTTSSPVASPGCWSSRRASITVLLAVGAITAGTTPGRSILLLMTGARHRS